MREGTVAFGVPAFPARATVGTAKNRTDGQAITLGTSDTIIAAARVPVVG